MPQCSFKLEHEADKVLDSDYSQIYEPLSLKKKKTSFKTKRTEKKKNVSLSIVGRKRNSPVDCDILYHSTESSSHPDMTLFVCGVCMFSLSVWLFQLPSTVQRHVRLTGDSKWCECDWEWLSLSLLSLWWTDNLSKVHPASCPITAGTDSRPETDKWMRKWMDGYLQKMSQNLDFKKKITQHIFRICLN